MKNQHDLGYRVLRAIFTPVFKLLYRPTIVNKHYLPRQGPAVIAGNHRHLLDPILVDVCTKRVVHALAKKELHDGKFGWLFRLVSTIPVDRQAAKNPDALNRTIEYLKDGRLISISPEGRRNRTDEPLLPFKYGAVVAAIKSNSPIVPYAITGVYKFFNNQLTIVYGPPLEVASLGAEEANQLLFDTVKALLLASVDGNPPPLPDVVER
ncbi:MAG: 1-acyl-sn-glycerol-3-phosphate acyltransferase [Propionibacteriaceae bacterium]|jgi:1-acyl-sn-glycerol-3-phosphate acyltransferase|nr:1-acyl-sn-glycerol-3-phosphate acyltransferase [Propionibacteriaceae bacterium]